MRRFIIDTDTASDDAVALVMAIKNPAIQVEAITVVGGNVGVDQAVQNALYTLEQCGKSIPVYKGSAKPLLRPLKNAHFVHGADGMGDIGLELNGRKPTPGNAIDILINTIEKYPDQIELITIGPLTNVAIALLKEPSIASKVKQCVVMGGIGQGPGNITPVSEYNIWVDPEAAKIVFDSGMKIKMVGWDISRLYATMDENDVNAVRALNTPLAHFTMAIQAKVTEFSTQVSKLPGFDLPDPIAMAIAIDESVATRTIKTHVEVICAEGSTRGQTVVDHVHTIENSNNIEVVLEASRDKFLQLLHQALL